jgi:uncharacterized BrkB/YihY/UPF0761 family membrane protein
MVIADRVRKPRWYAIPARILFFTFLMTLLGFAVSLLLSIVGLVIISKLNGTTPDLRFAYLHIALPVALLAGSIVLVLLVVMEVRHYRRAKALAGIARASQ